VQLNRLDWRRFLRLKNPAATALMARMNIRPEDRVRVKVQILRLLATMRLDREKMDLIAGFMDCYLALSAKEELAFQRDVAKIEDNKEKETVMELMTSWERKGRAEGRAEGRTEGWAEGRQAALVDLVNRQLARQVGPLSSALARQVSRLNGAQLEGLAEALLKFTSLDDLKRWLANAAAN
jgi:predicted transposase YdaD